ncbi:electron transfer flavoprotein subunit alpha/FixB family protein [Corynebacterium pseudogenitalium]|uniref:electron transfer flavoprotein subunit alpha/FixB family protein n=1 Tax=Corynebacterium pseudogenitalium TaxID=38303 RepID=UPI002109C3D5|nr:electron transfer flavoprotein subunit alpha/FixB family protein [Corynebacterium pseudogenitalium]UUA86814.1 electron transfer flavoprotein subunit alpha/FixB family protein [Corynebacterium pseudogenitalium]
MATSPRTVLVVLDATHDDQLDSTAAELIGAAAPLGTPVVLTTNPAHAEALGELGAAVVLTTNVDAQQQAVPLVDAAEAAFNATDPAAVILAHSVRGRDVASRLAVRKGKALLTDAIDVRRDDQGIVTDHENYGGAYTATAAATHSAPIITVRVGAIGRRADATAPEVHELDVTASGTRAATVTSVTPVVRTSTRPELLTADRVVAGGVALGDADMFEQLVGGLADELGAAVGATRSAADEDQISHDAQIGQTGIVVSPKLYIGIGISGAVQHLVGMQTADTIIAINNDEDAPLFDIADFGIIGDLFDVVPELIEQIAARRGTEASE